MKLWAALCRYTAAMTPRSIYLLAVGLLPIFLSLAFLALAVAAPEGARFGALWLSRYFAFWVDSVGLSLLLLTGGVFLLDYAEKRDGERR